MSVAGWKKKKQTAWILLGAGAIGTPLIICMFFLIVSQLHLKQELKGYKQKVEQKTFGEAYCLKNDKKAGDVIKESDLERITLSADAGKKLPSFRLEELMGKVVKVDMAKGSIVSRTLLTERENAGEDVRICTYTEIDYSGDVTAGSYADIRISFPNGEDYIVVRHKELLDVSKEERALTFCLGEAELLRLSSAFVDMEQYKDTRIYAVAYRDTLQEASVITYPVNPQVYALTGWDPNVMENDGVDSIEEGSRKEMEFREQLEKNLTAYRLESAPDSAAETENASSERDTDRLQTDSKQSENEMDEFFP